MITCIAYKIAIRNLDDYPAMEPKVMVKKRSGRLEPFDSRKMARAVSRAGVPYAMALEIAKAVRNERSLADEEQVSSTTLREMVAAELRSRNQDEVAKSYLGYKKTKSTKEEFERSVKHASRIRKSIKTNVKPIAREKEPK
jgi:transcriptional regulator NrdR family protein